MAAGLLRYSVGNEHDPGDPWGRSELVVEPDGTARLTHHFSRAGGSAAWVGMVDAAALPRLWDALQRANFPAVPTQAPVAGAALRRLTVETGQAAQVAVINARAAMSLAGYADAFDLLDGIVRQLSSDRVDYPTTQPPVVRDIAPAPAPPG